MASKDEIKAIIAALRGEDLGQLADEISKSIEKNEKLTNKQMKQLEKFRKSTNTTLNGLLKDYQKYLKGREALVEVDEIDKKNLEEKIKHYQKLSNGVHEISERQTSLTKITKDLNETRSRTLSTARDIIQTLNEEVSAVGLLDRALRGLEALYDTWFAVQTELTRAMGQAAMATGGTSAQLQELQSEAGGMRDMMFALNGTTIGWADSIRVVQDATTALRMDTGRMTEALGEDPMMQILAAERGLGIGAQQVAQLFRTLQTGIDGGNESLGEFTIGIREFADSIGANASQITQEFIDSRDALQRFGEDGSEVFRRTATYANHFGFETRRVLDMAARFDRFGQASENINQLNAMFGTTISSFELMQERDPVRRIETITDALREQGIEWSQMDFAQQNAIAESLGVSQSEAGRLVQGESMEEITRQREEEQRRQEAFAGRQMRIQETLMGIVEQTTTYFQRASDYIDLIRRDVAEALGPIFDAIRDSLISSNSSLRDWVRQIVGTPEFRQTIQSIAGWIRELPKHIDEFMPTWNEVYETAKGIWPVMESIGSAIGGAIDFVIEHKDQFVSAFEQAREAIARISLAFEQVRDAMTQVYSAVAPRVMSAIDQMYSAFLQIEGAMDRIYVRANAIGGAFSGMLAPLTPLISLLSPTGPLGPLVTIANEAPDSPVVSQIRGLATDSATVAPPAVGGAGGAGIGLIAPEMEAIFSQIRRTTQEAVSAGGAATGRSASTDVRPVSQGRVDTATVESPTATTSAVDVAPRVSQTSSFGSRIPNQQQQQQIVASDVNINGEKIGQIFFQIARR